MGASPIAVARKWWTVDRDHKPRYRIVQYLRKPNGGHMSQMEAMARVAKNVAPKPKCSNIMIDLETLDTSVDCAIVSIGAVKFNMDGYIDDEAFYASCSIESQMTSSISDSTLAWWMSQSDAARSVFAEPNKHTLENALHELKAFVDHDKYELWSNGADFDIPIINFALKRHGFKPLVMFYNHRCFRTIKNLYTNVPKPPYEGAQHNALIDAIQQAKWLQAIHAFRMEGKIASPPPLKGFSAKQP